MCPFVACACRQGLRTYPKLSGDANVPVSASSALSALQAAAQDLPDAPHLISKAPTPPSGGGGGQLSLFMESLLLLKLTPGPCSTLLPILLQLMAPAGQSLSHLEYSAVLYLHTMVLAKLD